MRSKQEKYSGQKSNSKSRYNRFYNSDNRRKSSNQAFNNHSNCNQNVFDIIKFQAPANMYQGNNFRSFNNQPYGNASHQQQGSPGILSHLPNHMGVCNVQDHFRNHMNQGFNKVIPRMNFHSPPPDYGMYGPTNNNMHQNHSTNQRMNYSTSTNSGKANEKFGKSPDRNQRQHESSDNSQTNKMCEVFNDVLGEKPPESNSSKSSGHTNPVPYGGNLSPFNSQNGNKTRNHRSRYRINYKRGNPDSNWESSKDQDRYHKVWDRDERQTNHQCSDSKLDGDNRDLSNDSSQNKQKKSEDPRKSSDTSSEKNSNESKLTSNEVPSEKNMSETKTPDRAYSTRSSKNNSNNTTNKSSDSKNSTTTTNKNNDISSKNNDITTKNSTHKDKSKEKEKDKEKDKEKHKGKEKYKDKNKEKEKSTSGEKSEKKKPSLTKQKQRFPSSSSSSGSDTDCVIEETPITQKSTISDVQKESSEKVKSKSKAITESTSSAISLPQNLGKNPKVTRDSPSEKKKKDSKNKESTPVQDKTPCATTIVSLTSPTSATSSSVALTTGINTTAPSVVPKKILSIGDAQKLMKPKTRKYARLADQIVKEFWEKRDRAQAASGSNPSSAIQPSGLDPSFNIDHLDLANLDFKDLKSDIPEELSDVINKVFDFSATEKNPIVLDDEDESTKKQNIDDQPSVDTTKRKRKNSESPVPRKRTKDKERKPSKHDEASSEVATKKSKKDANTEQLDVEHSSVQVATTTSSANEPSTSPATSNVSPGPQPSSSLPPGILEILLQLSLKEDEIQGHISNLDNEIEDIQAMIADLSHKLTSKKHHRDMMANEEKRLKAFRIQALRGWWSIKSTNSPFVSVDSNKTSPELQQQFLNCMSQPSSEPIQLEGGNMTFHLGEDKVINIVPQTDDIEDESNILRRINISRNFVPSYHDGSVGSRPASRTIMSPSRQVMSPPPRPTDNQSGPVRYLGILNDLSHLFRRPGSVNSEVQKHHDVNSTSKQEVQAHNKRNNKSADSGDIDISKVKAELENKN